MCSKQELYCFSTECDVPGVNCLYIIICHRYVIKMKKRAKVLPEGGHQQQQPTQGLRANAKVEVVEEVEDA